MPEKPHMDLQESRCDIGSKQWLRGDHSQLTQLGQVILLSWTCAPHLENGFFPYEEGPMN